MASSESSLQEGHWRTCIRRSRSSLPLASPLPHPTPTPGLLAVKDGEAFLPCYNIQLSNFWPPHKPERQPNKPNPWKPGAKLAISSPQLFFLGILPQLWKAKGLLPTGQGGNTHFWVQHCFSLALFSTRSPSLFPLVWRDRWWYCPIFPTMVFSFFSQELILILSSPSPKNFLGPVGCLMKFKQIWCHVHWKELLRLKSISGFATNKE